MSKSADQQVVRESFQKAIAMLEARRAAINVAIQTLKEIMPEWDAPSPVVRRQANGEPWDDRPGAVNLVQL